MSQHTKRNRLGIALLTSPFLVAACLICSRLFLVPGFQWGLGLLPSEESEPEEEVEATPIVSEAIEEYLEARPIMTVEAPYDVGRSGSIDELGGVHEGVVYPGDNANNKADFQGFMTFDLSTVPGEADVEEAVLAFGSCTISGRPFHEPPVGLGTLFVEVVAYGELESEDYADPTEVEISYPLDHCPPHGIDVTEAVHATREVGELQLRLRFDGSNGDTYRDDVTFEEPSLTILYLLGEETP